jgi:hypothetical protein
VSCAVAVLIYRLIHRRELAYSVEKEQLYQRHLAETQQRERKHLTEQKQAGNELSAERNLKHQLHDNLEDVLISYQLADVPVTLDSERLCAIASQVVEASEEDWELGNWDRNDDSSSDEDVPGIAELYTEIVALERDLLKSDADIAALRLDITALNSDKASLRAENARLLSE